MHKHSREDIEALTNALSPTGRRVASEVFAAVRDLPSDSKRYVLLEVSRKLASLKSGEVNRKSVGDDICKEAKRLAAIQRELDSMLAWAASDNFALQAARGSLLHRFRESYRAGLFDASAPFERWRCLIEGSPFVFVVEHDWARAFKGALDFEDGNIRLPYPECVFELHMDGKRIIALLDQREDGTVACLSFVASGEIWFQFVDSVFNGSAIEVDGVKVKKGAEGLAETIFAQVRAICISLEAEVAEVEVERAPHKLVASRKKLNRPPPVDFHVVRLAKRHRAAPMGRTPGAEPKWRVRLHFRRGHWRHYENHKTWVRWMLVGNPDLGFIDKEYRL